MTSAFRVDIDDREVLEFLARLIGRIDDMSPVMADVAQALESETEARFAAEGPGWPDLSPATINDRERSGYWPGLMLQRTGALAREIESGHDDHSAWVAAGGATSRDYAAAQFLGAMAGRNHAVKIPARMAFPIDDQGALTDDARQTILEILGDYLQNT